ncbi:hypothetical protein F3Y22_tig00111105pilonHSYRG00502 [Hibiscus syriacus]|uniref:Reverse transcriptase zinc-binding domain-containing protein n=1 Tax=Hibiscus syriacus TaxID=106335 RepID=A0A6A2YZC8_HIBSY|nr:hypothetical protein F3Y22_tig00111105pilonHSYRG00502 [Hibiscus syriacus]
MEKQFCSGKIVGASKSRCIMFFPVYTDCGEGDTRKNLVIKEAFIPNQSDKIIWFHDSSGLFSVKELSDLLLNVDAHESVFNFDKIWKLKVPPKVRSFLWLLKLGRIPIKEFQSIKSILQKDSDKDCPWCSSNVEDANHFMVNCVSALNFWSALCNRWSIQWCAIALRLTRYLPSASNVGWTGKSRSAWLITEDWWNDSVQCLLRWAPASLASDWCPPPSEIVKFNVEGVRPTRFQAEGKYLVNRRAIAPLNGPPVT